MGSHHQVLLCLPESSEERLALALLRTGASALGDSQSALFVLVFVCGFCFVFFFFVSPICETEAVW